MFPSSTSAYRLVRFRLYLPHFGPSSRSIPANFVCATSLEASRLVVTHVVFRNHVASIASDLAECFLFEFLVSVILLIEPCVDRRAQAKLISF